MDANWWKVYSAEVESTFKGMKASITGRSSTYKAKQIMNSGGYPMQTFGNSGAGAIALAALWGAARVILLGYDCSKPGGQSHWHGAHPKTLGDAMSMPLWQSQFTQLRRSLPRLDVVNCSRHSALKMFPRATLEEALA